VRRSSGEPDDLTRKKKFPKAISIFDEEISRKDKQTQRVTEESRWLDVWVSEKGSLEDDPFFFRPISWKPGPAL
jgi:hypothetical protein